MKSILITGGTGLIGKKLISQLDIDLYKIIVLTRRKSYIKKGIHFMNWDPDNNKLDLTKINELDTIINLVGESIDKKRWTKKQKLNIYNSRIKTTQLLFSKIKELEILPKNIISASAIAIYKSNTKESQKEESIFEDDYLARVVKNWEKENIKFKSLGIRTVILRIGIVLSNHGGILKKLFPIFKLGLGVPLGSGKQIMSWIHIDDLVRMILYCQKHHNIRGFINAVSPIPVSNSCFTNCLSKTLGVIRYPSFVKAPSIIIKILFGEVANVIFNGKNVSSKKIEDLKFKFLYKNLDDALIDFYCKK
jgi:uncharacterized protein (TIGR01777 family)|tara:strand:+ start:282 stop:1199 length:918 start_codon:yes stop_codon:yes gene_type:complete